MCCPLVRLAVCICEMLHAATPCRPVLHLTGLQLSGTQLLVAPHMNGLLTGHDSRTGRNLILLLVINDGAAANQLK